jgi:hypothetical protein
VKWFSQVCDFSGWGPWCSLLAKRRASICREKELLMRLYVTLELTDMCSGKVWVLIQTEQYVGSSTLPGRN